VASCCSWSSRSRALSSALASASVRFLPLRARTSSRYLEFCSAQGPEPWDQRPVRGQRSGVSAHLRVQPLLLSSSPLVVPLQLLHPPPDRRSRVRSRVRTRSARRSRVRSVRRSRVRTRSARRSHLFWSTCSSSSRTSSCRAPFSSRTSSSRVLQPTSRTMSRPRPGSHGLVDCEGPHGSPSRVLDHFLVLRL